MGRQFTKGDKFLGVPMVKARNVLKAWRYGGSENASDICGRKDVGLDAPVVAMLLQEFENRGLIGIENRPLSGDEFTGLTEAGIAFVTASGKARTPKAKAKVALDALLARCAVLNADPDAPYHVDKIWLYGSMIRDVSDVGDVDLIFDKKWSPAYMAIADETERHCRSQAYALDILPRGAVQDGISQVYAAHLLFDRQVNGGARNPLFSLGSKRDFLSLACPCQLVFDADAGGPVVGAILDRHPDAGERHPDVKPAPEMPDLLPSKGPIVPIDDAYSWQVDLNFAKNRNLGIFDPESHNYYHVVQARRKAAGCFIRGEQIGRYYVPTKASRALAKVTGIDGTAVSGMLVPPPSDHGKAKATAAYVVERRISEGSNAVSYDLVMRTLVASDRDFHGQANAVMPVLLNAAADIVRIARLDDEAGRERPIVVDITTEGRFDLEYGWLIEKGIRRPDAWLGTSAGAIIPRLQVTLNGEAVSLTEQESSAPGLQAA